jgi:hypothetical protein
MELLRARTSKNISDSQIDVWLKRSFELDKPEEVWLVGGMGLHRMSPHHLVSGVLVEDVLEPGARQVSVEIHRAKGRPRKILLELPENSACIRLLRDPYQIGVSVPQKLPITASLSGLVFAHGGRRLFSTAGDSTLVSFPVPNSPWDTPGNAKQHALGNIGRIVAANRLGRSTMVVSVDEISLRVTYVGKESYPVEGHYFLRLDQFTWPKEKDHCLLFPCVRPPLPQGEKSSIFVLDISGNLFRLEPTMEENAALLEESGVLALTSFGGIPAYLSFDREKRKVEYKSVGRELFRAVVMSDCESIDRAFFGYGAHTQAPFCLHAIQKSPAAWMVVSGRNSANEIRTEQKQEVVGVIQEPNYAEALLTLRENRHVVTLKGPDWERPLFESSDSIAQLTVSTSKPWIAYSTVNGEVTVHSLPLARTLCRFVNWGRND